MSSQPRQKIFLKKPVSHREISKITFENIRLYPGENTLSLSIAGKGSDSDAVEKEFGFVSAFISPCAQRYIREWNIIGPFDAPDMSWLHKSYPPEKELSLSEEYPGKDSKKLKWETASADKSGFIPLQRMISPNERAVAYALAYVYSPDDREATLLIGSDDGIKIWLNNEPVHMNPAYRGAYPDQDKIKANLNKGKNTLLLKVLQGGGGWGFYARFVDPDKELTWKTE